MSLTPTVQGARQLSHASRLPGHADVDRARGWHLGVPFM